MKKIDNVSNRKLTNRLLALLFVIVLVVAIRQHIVRQNIDKFGIYTKATIKKRGRGSSLIVTYTYMGHEYKELIGSTKEGQKIGESIFIKILPDKPTAILNLEKINFPDCLKKVEVPPQGWTEIPGCP
jgi:hypothetical protein